MWINAMLFQEYYDDIKAITGKELWKNYTDKKYYVDNECVGSNESDLYLYVFNQLFPG